MFLVKIHPWILSGHFPLWNHHKLCFLLKRYFKTPFFGACGGQNPVSRSEFDPFWSSEKTGCWAKTLLKTLVGTRFLVDEWYLLVSERFALNNVQTTIFFAPAARFPPKNAVFWSNLDFYTILYVTLDELKSHTNHGGMRGERICDCVRPYANLETNSGAKICVKLLALEKVSILVTKGNTLECPGGRSM
jgi:hypothetical protein